MVVARGPETESRTRTVPQHQDTARERELDMAEPAGAATRRPALSSGMPTAVQEQLQALKQLTRDGLLEPAVATRHQDAVLHSWRASRPVAYAADTEDRLRESAIRGRRKLRDKVAEVGDCRRELEQQASAIARGIAEIRVDESGSQAAVDAVFARARKMLEERQQAMANAIAERYAAEVEPLQRNLRVASTAQAGLEEVAAMAGAALAEDDPLAFLSSNAAVQVRVEAEVGGGAAALSHLEGAQAAAEPAGRPSRRARCRRACKLVDGVEMGLSEAISGWLVFKAGGDVTIQSTSGDDGGEYAYQDDERESVAVLSVAGSVAGSEPCSLAGSDEWEETGLLGVRQEAAAGDETAQYALGCCLQNGPAPPPASTRTPRAQVGERGRHAEIRGAAGLGGAAVDLQAAVYWYEKAGTPAAGGEQGLAAAQFALGHCYQHGHGVLAPDLPTAIKWCATHCVQRTASCLPDWRCSWWFACAGTGLRPGSSMQKRSARWAAAISAARLSRQVKAGRAGRVGPSWQRRRAGGQSSSSRQQRRPGCLRLSSTLGGASCAASLWLSTCPVPPATSSRPQTGGTSRRSAGWPRYTRTGTRTRAAEL